MPDGFGIQPWFPYQNANQQRQGGIVQPYKSNDKVTFNPVSFAFWMKPVLQDTTGQFTGTAGAYYTPGVEGNTYANNPWDYLYLGLPLTQPYTPGIAKVTVEDGKMRSFDRKKPVGSDGERVTIHGIRAAMVSIELTIWTPEQLRQVAQLWPLLFPAINKGNPPAVDVSHPELDLHRIKSLIFLGAKGPEINRNREGVFTMKAIEFIKPGSKNAVNTPVQALGSLLDPGAVATPDQNSANLAPR